MGVRSVLTVPLRGPRGRSARSRSATSTRAAATPTTTSRSRSTSPAGPGPTVDNALRYEHEQATATALQRNLLPERLPEVDGLSMAARYLPGSEGLKVGGDWYDVVPLPDGTVALAIGDVVGHGVRAAATMGRFRTALEFCLLDGTASAAATIARVNRYVTTANEAEMATLLVLLLDPATGDVRYASAGHLPALVQSSDGSTRWLDDSRGVPLGATDTARSTEARDRLAPATSWCSTPTVSSSAGPSRSTSGSTASRRALGRVAAGRRSSPDAIADGLVSELLGRTARADDVALLVVGLRRRARCVPLDADVPCRSRASSSVLRAVAARPGSAAPRSPSRVVDEIILATNEVGANAVEHAYGLSDATFDSGPIDRRRRGRPSSSRIDGKLAPAATGRAPGARARPRPRVHGRRSTSSRARPGPSCG